jgi:hypothetical protein
MKWAKAPRHASLIAAVFLLGLCAAPITAASESTTINASLTPEHLGAGTTINVGFQITAPHGAVPSPLTALDLRYPANIDLVDSGLGLAACPLATLELIGPEGCTAESLMGHGSAEIEMPIGDEVLHATGSITTWMAPIEHGHLGLIFYAESHSPVATELTFPGIVLSAPPPYGLSLNTRIPEIPSIPGAPEPSVVRLTASIGPRNVTYYNRKHGKYVPYQPDGLLLPSHCPSGGFPFAATFTFRDGTSSSAVTTVPCPKARRGRGR